MTRLSSQPPIVESISRSTGTAGGFHAAALRLSLKFEVSWTSIIRSRLFSDVRPFGRSSSPLARGKSSFLVGFVL